MRQKLYIVQVYIAYEGTFDEEYFLDKDKAEARFEERQRMGTFSAYADLELVEAEIYE